MKLAGIAGVIVDWYGVRDSYDYGTIHRNTQHLIKYVKKAGLEFAICYEDQTIKHMIKGKGLVERDAVRHGREVIGWLAKNWFGDSAYLKVDGRPALLVFGPQYFTDRQWRDLLSGLSPAPYFYTLNRRRSCADGAFGWPPMRNGETTAPARWRQYLRDLYQTDKDGKAVVGAAFPGFHDIYQDAGLHPSYGFLDERGGKTFEETLELGLKSKSRIIQIVTWNDYGEGTNIEPTCEYGYRYLEMTQRLWKRHVGSVFPYSPQDLRIPLRLYRLRKKYRRDGAILQDLDTAFERLSAGRIEDARRLILKHRDK